MSTWNEILNPINASSLTLFKKCKKCKKKILVGDQFTCCVCQNTLCKKHVYVCKICKQTYCKKCLRSSFLKRDVCLYCQLRKK